MFFGLVFSANSLKNAIDWNYNNGLVIHYEHLPIALLSTLLTLSLFLYVKFKANKDNED